MELRGTAFVFGKNIDTDQIYPGRYLELHEPGDIAKHIMEGADPNFVKKVKEGDIIVASTNFGCGSSREHAALAIKHAGIGGVVAESFAGIFYRNCINVGVPVVICPNVSGGVTNGDELAVDLVSGLVKNITRDTVMQGEALSEHIVNIIRVGGIVPLFRATHGGQVQE